MIDYEPLAKYYGYQGADAVSDLTHDYHNGKKFAFPDSINIECRFLYYYLTRSEYNYLHWFRVVLNYLQKVYEDHVIEAPKYEEYVCRLISGSQAFNDLNTIQLNILNKWIESAFDMR